MKKRLISVLLAAAMAATMVAGCGSEKDTSSEAKTDTGKE